MSKAAARVGLPVVLGLARAVLGLAGLAGLAVLGLAVLGLALVGCTGRDQLHPLSVAGTAADAAASTESPATTVQSQAPRGGEPGISLASLPVGNPSGFSLPGESVQCIHVEWTPAAAIPQGLGVLVTGATFEPEVYRPASSSCERPTCLGHVFHGSDLSCDLSIRPLRASATSLLNNPAVITSLTGRLLCPDFAADPCRTFAGQLRAQAQKLSLKLPAEPMDRQTSTGWTGTGGSMDTPPRTADPSPSG